MALGEIADATVSPAALNEELIHSLQKFVEVDEPEPDTTPIVAVTSDSGGGSEDDEIQFDRMSEEDLLKGLEGLTPPDDRE